MEFRLSAAEEAFRAEVRRWLDAAQPAARWGTPAYASRTRGGEDRRLEGVAGDAVRRRAGPASPGRAAYGGRGATLVEQLIFNEECAAADAPDSINLAVALGLVGPTLMACGTPEQQARFLPRILARRRHLVSGLLGAQCRLRSRRPEARAASVDGDTIVVTGQKIWTSFAQYADWCILVVRTNPTRRASTTA